MTRIILLSIATLALVVDGYVSGRWTDRWSDNQAIEKATEALAEVPLKIGDWQGEQRDLGARQAERAGFAGYWLRRYERGADGASVNVMLACGRSGPLCVHTPDVCYAGAGFSPTSPPEKYATKVGSKDVECWRTVFAKRDAAVPVSLRLFWTWRAGGAWKVASNPRFEYAGLPVLYKMYITREVVHADPERDDAICADFVKVFLPVLDRTLGQ